ncbi:MAG: Ig-like domain-containing protein [Ardenticatenaceae bacterium]|nr:Ig-like domain-containing protein [Ardenticatenaceae bacterium]
MPEIHSPSSVSAGTTRRYALMLAPMVLLAAALAVLLLNGSHQRLRMRLDIPGGARAASSRPRLTLHFAQAVAPASVEPRLSLAPPVPFTLTWHGDEVQIVPGEALQPGATYTVSLTAGVTAPDGQPLQGAAKWRFTTRPLRLLFLALPAGENAGTSLRVAPLDGTGSRPLSASGQPVQDFGVSPDGSEVIYSVAEEPGTTNFWRVRPGERGWSRLTDGEGVVYSAPRWSPAGDIIAYEERRVLSIAGEAQLSNPHVALMRPDGTPAGLVYGSAEEAGHSPIWSPDGTRLALYDANTETVAIFNFTGTPLRVAAGSSGVGSWSPNGRKLVTTAILPSGQGVRQVLRVHDLEVGTETVIEEPVGQMADPAWSPDGEWIAYAYQPPLGLGRGSEIALLRPDDSQRIALVSSPEAILSTPVWAPAGDWLAFSKLAITDSGARPELWVIRRDGSALRRIAASAYLPQWLP